MRTNLRLADLRLATAQQRSTGQNLPSDLYEFVAKISGNIQKEARLISKNILVTCGNSERLLWQFGKLCAGHKHHAMKVSEAA
jgi:hypothetical protein